MEQTKIAQHSKKYIIFLMVYMIFYEFMDSYTTSYYTTVVSYIEADLGIDHSAFFLIQAIASIGLLFVIFIQNLTDIVGRKPMMIIVFFGMGLASFILFLSNSILTFTIGFLFLWIFFSSDIWVIIISEEAPAEKRAIYSYIIAGVGALGAVAIPICRGIFITVAPEVDPTVWRGMTYLALLAIPLSLLGFGLKETTAFENRKLDDSKEIEKGWKAQWKTLLLPLQGEHKTKVIVFMVFGFLLGASAAAISLIEAFFTNIIVTEHGASPDVVTNIILVSVLGTFVFFGITGVLADRFGRKRLFYVYFTINVIAFIVLIVFAEPIVASESYWILMIAGFFENGSFWGIFMLSKTFCVENFPTSIRGTCAGWRSMMYAVGLIFGSLISSALAAFLSLGTIFLIFIILIAVVMIPLIAKYLPEMKGVTITDD